MTSVPVGGFGPDREDAQFPICQHFVQEDFEFVFASGVF
jgi:hypothetical protein